jgi:ribonuclease D
MTPETMVAIAGIVLVVVSILFIAVRKLPKRLKAAHYIRKWRDIQRLCADKSNWPQAILLSDELLNEVLRKKQKNGKTMGERMVSAQKQFTSNDAVWKAHKIANKIRTQELPTLKEIEVKESLVAYRQALRDLGAL